MITNNFKLKGNTLNIEYINMGFYFITPYYENITAMDLMNSDELKEVLQTKKIKVSTSIDESTQKEKGYYVII